MAIVKYSLEEIKKRPSNKEELERFKNADIDYSDIPILTDEQLQNAKKRRFHKEKNQEL